ncbi:MAG: hypothetical protein R6X25_03780 [Candidatus Krumholzibacteriia bacterium]
MNDHAVTVVPRLRRLLLAAVIGAAALVVGPPGAVGAEAARPAPGDDPVPTVANPREAPRREAVTLQELWRAGGDDDEVLIGKVGSAAADAEGRVYALDSQLAHVLAFAPDGGFLGTRGRQGDGPGEMRQPIGLSVGPDGRLHVVQTFPGKIISLDPQGNPAGSISLGGNDPGRGGFGFVFDARTRAGQTVVAGLRSVFDGASGEIRETRFLATVEPGGAEVRRHAEIACTRNLERFTIDELAEFYPGERGLWDLGPDGRLWLVNRYDAYEIAVLSPDGVRERLVTRPHEARRRTDEEIREIRASMRMNINGREPEISHVVQPRARCITRLHVLDDGTLWVENSHGRDRWDSAGVVVYDVFDAQGRLLKEVEVTVPQGGEDHRLILLADGRFLLALGMADLSVSISAGSGESVAETSAPDVDVLPELVCFAAP